ncbi:hypothetical protein KQI28_17805 [Stenotrophomonas maltophilia]|nr:hypothetical protein [Stenotrophomonas maltophilia]
MFSPTSYDFTVAMAGLELLPATRLKLACSLLAAERLTVRLVEWGAEPAALLVADETSHAGRHAIQSARQDNVPSIRLHGAPVASGTTQALPRLATVREFVDVLKSSLKSSPSRAMSQPSAWDVPLVQPMLEHMRLDRRREKRTLLELGLFRLVSDTRNGQVHMLRRMPLNELLGCAVKSDWRVRELTEDEWKSVYLPDVTRSYETETLWWRLLPYLSNEDLPLVTDELRLRTWPDLDVGATPASWALALAYLDGQSWRAGSLASVANESVDEVQRIMALVRLSGLEASLSDPGASVRAVASRHAETLLRMAKRFGLKLFGKAHG